MKVALAAALSGFSLLLAGPPLAAQQTPAGGDAQSTTMGSEPQLSSEQRARIKALVPKDTPPRSARVAR